MRERYQSKSLDHTWFSGRSKLLRNLLPVPLEGEKLATLPVGTHGWATLGRAMGLAAKTTVGTSSGGDAAELTVLHDWGADPVDARVTTDALVGWINHDDLEVLEGSILVHPVRVEHTKVAAATSATLLGDTAQGAPGLQCTDTSIARLSVHLTLVDWTLAATTTDAHTVDAVSLLGLVSKTASLVRAGRLGGPVDSWHLPELPSAGALEEAQNIRLLAVPKLTKVFVCSHFRCSVPASTTTSLHMWP